MVVQGQPAGGPCQAEGCNAPCPHARNKFCEQCFDKLKGTGKIKMQSGKVWTLRPPMGQRQTAAICAVLHADAPLDTVDGMQVDEDCVAYWMETVDCMNNHDHASEYTAVDGMTCEGEPMNPYQYDEAYDVHETPWYQAAEAFCMQHGQGTKRTHDEVSAFHAEQMHGSFSAPEPMYQPQAHALEHIRATDAWSQF